MLRHAHAKDMAGNVALLAEGKLVEPLEMLQLFFVFFGHWQLWSLETCLTVERFFLCFLNEFLCIFD
jgi:hypothetical protein